MGIFVDRCQAIIDPETGRALTGEVLRQAKGDSRAKRCGHDVKKSARFCSKCGSGAPQGWTKCTSCGKWVGNESEHCWNCGTRLYPEQRTDLSGGRWQKTPGMVGERFEAADLQRVAEQGLVIEEGTLALLLEDGKLVGLLEPGRHKPGEAGFLAKLAGKKPSRSIVLIDAAELILPLRIEGLRSKEDMEVQYYGELILKMNPNGAEGFLKNCLADNRSVSFQDLSEMLEGEIRSGIENFCNSTSIEALVKDPERRLQLELVLKDHLETAFQQWGILLERVSSAEFYGKAYEAIRMKAGEAEARRREVEFSEKIREIATKEKMDEFRSEKEIEEYVASLAHEKGISDERRLFELGRLQQVHRHEMEVADLAHELDEERKRAKQDLELRAERDAYGREKLVADTKADVEAAEVALELRRKKNAVAREELAERAKLFEGRDMATLITLIEDPGKRADLMKIHQQESLKGRDVEEILALTAGDSPEIAKALAEMMKARREGREADQELIRDLSEKQAEKLERIMEKAIQAAGSGGGNTIINK